MKFRKKLKTFYAAILVILLAGNCYAIDGDNFKETYYYPMTYGNIAKLYIAMDAVDIDSVANIDSYMRINECELFESFSENEIDWSDIRKATQKSIELSKSQFPTRFTFVQPITLGVYNAKKKAFSVTKDTAMWGINRFEARAIDKSLGLCGLRPSESIIEFPNRFVLDTAHPFVLTDVQVDPKTAREEILKWGNDRRTVYVVMKIRFVSARPELYQISKAVKVPHLMAVLERYDVYTDAELTKHLSGDVVRKDIK